MVTSVFQILAQAGDLVADGMPPPRAAPEPPPCQDIFSAPSLTDFVMTNADAGHVKTVAVKAADFAVRLSMTDWALHSTHFLVCEAVASCEDLSADECEGGRYGEQSYEYKNYGYCELERYRYDYDTGAHIPTTPGKCRRFGDGNVDEDGHGTATICEVDTPIASLGGMSLSDCGLCGCQQCGSYPDGNDKNGCSCYYQAEGDSGPEDRYCQIPPAGPCVQWGEEDRSVLDRELSDALIHDVLTPARTVLGTFAPSRFRPPRTVLGAQGTLKNPGDRSLGIVPGQETRSYETNSWPR
jgi:hypothetical protein